MRGNPQNAVRDMENTCVANGAAGVSRKDAGARPVAGGRGERRAEMRVGVSEVFQAGAPRGRRKEDSGMAKAVT